MSEEEINKIIEVYDNAIADLKQENQQLKVNCNIGNENLNFYRQENKRLKEENERFKCLLDSQVYKDLDKKAQQLDLYKSVIDEIRKYIKTRKELYEKCNIMDLYKELKPVLEIIDKTKGEENGK